MNLPKKTVIPRLAHALRYSCEGITGAWKSEAAFRQEVFLFAFAAPVAMLLPVSGAERALMIASVLLVLVVELINTAIEAVVDRISPEIHPLSKRAKDCGSAAVLLSLVNTTAIWLVILL